MTDSVYRRWLDLVASAPNVDPARRCRIWAVLLGLALAVAVLWLAGCSTTCPPAPVVTTPVDVNIPVSEQGVPLDLPPGADRPDCRREATEAAKLRCAAAYLDALEAERDALRGEIEDHNAALEHAHPTPTP